MAKCPICGRTVGIYTNDPLLTTPSLSTDEFKGFIHLIRTHIEELQIERHQQEIDSGVTPLTEFFPINDTGFFQNIKQYILELRDSTEKILTVTGMSLHDFLSTDEDGNPMTSKDDWTDTNLEEIKYQCKAIHIEDLRHFLSALIWQETWEKNYQIVDTYYKSRNVPNPPSAFSLRIVDVDKVLPIFLNSDTSQYAWDKNDNTSPLITNSLVQIDILAGKKLKIIASGSQFVSYSGISVSWWIEPALNHYTYPLWIKYPVIINSNSCISFDTSLISFPGFGDIGKPYGHILTATIWFSNTANRLLYRFNPTSSAYYTYEFGINNIGLITFTRNIYDDYKLAWGSYPLGRAIIHFSFGANMTFHQINDGVTYTNTVELDNIALKSIISPVITPAIQGIH